MTSVVDLWRAVDPDATLVSGAVHDLGRPVRAVERTRALAPLLPEMLDGSMLIADGSLVQDVDQLLAALASAELKPVAVIVSGASPVHGATEDGTRPVMVSELPPPVLFERAASYLSDEPAWLGRLSTDLRLLCAEAALSEPEVATPAGLMAARTRRGVAVVEDGELRTLHPRRAGRALAARFAAIHSRLLVGHGQRDGASRGTRDGLWLLGRQIRPGASVWFFDDQPFAVVDEVAADAAAVTLRALLRRRPEPKRSTPRPAQLAAEPLPDDPLIATLLVVARNNGRVAPAARELGVHRNTVLYRLRRARDEHGIDPRRPSDALRILASSATASEDIVQSAQ